MSGIISRLCTQDGHPPLTRTVQWVAPKEKENGVLHLTLMAGGITGSKRCQFESRMVESTIESLPIQPFIALPQDTKHPNCDPTPV